MKKTSWYTGGTLFLHLSTLNQQTEFSRHYYVKQSGFKCIFLSATLLFSK